MMIFTLSGPVERLERPLWLLEHGQGSCSVCGFLTGFALHYVHAGRAESHCTACHRIGHEWEQPGDSQQMPGDKRDHPEQDREIRISDYYRSET